MHRHMIDHVKEKYGTHAFKINYLHDKLWTGLTYEYGMVSTYNSLTFAGQGNGSEESWKEQEDIALAKLFNLDKAYLMDL